MKKMKEMAVLLMGLGVAVLILYIMGIGCPIKRITGISCAGCGMTRAIVSVLHLDFRQAFYYHPLFWSLPLLFVFYFFWERLPNRMKHGVIWIIIIIFACVYIIRLLDPDDNVVVVDVHSGLIADFISFLR